MSGARLELGTQHWSDVHAMKSSASTIWKRHTLTSDINDTLHTSARFGSSRQRFWEASNQQHCQHPTYTTQTLGQSHGGAASFGCCRTTRRPKRRAQRKKTKKGGRKGKRGSYQKLRAKGQTQKANKRARADPCRKGKRAKAKGKRRTSGQGLVRVGGVLTTGG